jgi:predicted metal-binding protein
MKPTKLTPQASPVSEALILICEKCGKKLAPDSEPNPARELQLLLKEKIKNQGKKGQLRAVITSCMDLCPKGEIAIGISVTAGKNRYFTLEGVDHEAASELLFEQLDKKGESDS